MKISGEGSREIPKNISGKYPQELYTKRNSLVTKSKVSIKTPKSQAMPINRGHERINIAFIKSAGKAILDGPLGIRTLLKMNRPQNDEIKAMRQQLKDNEVRIHNRSANLKELKKDPIKNLEIMRNVGREISDLEIKNEILRFQIKQNNESLKSQIKKMKQQFKDNEVRIHNRSTNLKELKKDPIKNLEIMRNVGREISDLEIKNQALRFQIKKLEKS